MTDYGTRDEPIKTKFFRITGQALCGVIVSAGALGRALTGGSILHGLIEGAVGGGGVTLGRTAPLQTPAQLILAAGLALTAYVNRDEIASDLMIHTLLEEWPLLLPPFIGMFVGRWHALGL